MLSAVGTSVRVVEATSAVYSRPFTRTDTVSGEAVSGSMTQPRTRRPDGPGESSSNEPNGSNRTASARQAVSPTPAPWLTTVRQTVSPYRAGRVRMKAEPEATLNRPTSTPEILA
ncbi:hypothetical protein [Micromonospora sp. WMMD712]|uniref:hypothetical protein n=1 Tax=Micromonospora sp. WMMD712 TaxID=3016096 RepID=UPI00249A58C9|nr:hypothetical protein [Micromonospora sp. WMMD712]WFE58613.1 hypothetical protein O7633_17945 [Micromonospora sp. WMMD712]